MEPALETVSPKDYFPYAADDHELWSSLHSCRVTHAFFGPGQVTSIDGAARVTVRFDNPYEDRIERLFAKAAFLDGKFTTAEIPRAMFGRLHAAKTRREEVERLAQLKREEEERRQLEEAYARTDFARLKEKYGIPHFPDTSPVSLLYKLLLQLEEGAQLSGRELEWLEGQSLFPILAHYHEQEYRRSGSGYSLVHASSNWRKAKQPERSIALTEGFRSDDTSHLAIVLTTRGGALRDVGRLQEAEACARRSIQLNPNAHQPYNLLGALCYQTGRPQAGDTYFQRAEELGAVPSLREQNIQKAVQAADAPARRLVAEYLLKKDPERYEWARRYL